ncbi:MAG: hypothetical protein JXR48_03975 [Candidatus Delongbacteria bacterium]|nr:hypothetical protein [Candidatus Delongbacteria bacterium]MBN2834104.1 hypothetical protein [Candidatus Delongbacteria bacterium]
MIAEEYNNRQVPQISVPKGKTISFIINILKKTPPYFILAINTEGIIKPLNENKLTQILVEQINVCLYETGVPIFAQNQYSDLFFGTKGIPDFYFYELEKGKTNIPLFVVEAKILPAPLPKEREKEYVIGDNKNGGIERFKIGKHAKGLNQCGMIGFVQQNNFEFWKNEINDWIETLSINDTFWNIDEKLEKSENLNDYSYLQSIAHRKLTDDIKIHHFWIKI